MLSGKIIPKSVMEPVTLPLQVSNSPNIIQSNKDTAICSPVSLLQNKITFTLLVFITVPIINVICSNTLQPLDPLMYSLNFPRALIQSRGQSLGFLLHITQSMGANSGPEADYST